MGSTNPSHHDGKLQTACTDVWTCRQSVHPHTASEETGRQNGEEKEEEMRWQEMNPAIVTEVTVTAVTTVRT